MSGAAHSIERHETENGSWELVRRPPPAALAGIVDGLYCGWTESGTQGPGTIRRELPSTKIPLIFNFGAGYRVGAPGAPIEAAEVRGSFVVGLYDSFAETQATGPTLGVQVDLTPLGAFRLLGGLPMAELYGRAVALTDVLGRNGGALVERLPEERDWEARFRLLDETLLRRLADGPAPLAPVAFAWRRLMESGGTAAIAPLAEAAGWSQKHLIERFRQHVGVAPKRLARILRFSRFTARLGREAAVHWAGLAFESGYYDQAHLIRDCHAFAGCTPRELLARRLPGGGWLGGAMRG